MLRFLNQKFKLLCSKLPWPIHRRSSAKNPKIVVMRLGQLDPETTSNGHSGKRVDPIRVVDQVGMAESGKSIRIASFNAALFSMAPAVPNVGKSGLIVDDQGDEKYLKAQRAMEIDIRAKSLNDRPKGILKQSPLHSRSITSSSELISKQLRFAKSKLRVSINLPDNEISLERCRQLNFAEEDGEASSRRNQKGKAPVESSSSFPTRRAVDRRPSESLRNNRTVLEILREVDADILALQDVKADEEKGMKPLSDLADALGMRYVFAESWAPEYGNAVLSKWPIKRWKVQKIIDDTDFRNVLKATIDVPQAGEVNFHCTHLDHLDEKWRMKQISAIMQYDDTPHILVGGLNSLDETDYSAERWTDIVKYYEEIGKPTPKVEVMKFLKGKQYVDAKNFAGECESVVMIAKGQDVQGTCKYGTRVDYILASPGSPYQFVPGTYAVASSKGTSDHHIVKVDIKIANTKENVVENRRSKHRVVRIINASSRGIWKTNS